MPSRRLLRYVHVVSEPFVTFCTPLNQQVNLLRTFGRKSRSRFYVLPTDVRAGRESNEPWFRSNWTFQMPVRQMENPHERTRSCKLYFIILEIKRKPGMYSPSIDIAVLNYVSGLEQIKRLNIYYSTTGCQGKIKKLKIDMSTYGHLPR